MNRSRQVTQKQGAGIIKNIIAGILFLLFLFNLQDQILKNQDIIRRSYLTLPFLFISIMSLFIEPKKYISISIMICAVYSATDKLGATDFSVILFILSYAVLKNNKYGILVIAISIITATIRSQLFGMTIYQYFNQLMAYGAMFLLSYLMIFKQHKKRVDLWKEISEKEKAILKLFMRGKDYSQISHILNINDKKESIRTSITRCRNLSGCDNDIQFGIWLSDKG